MHLTAELGLNFHKVHNKMWTIVLGRMMRRWKKVRAVFALKRLTKSIPDKYST